MPARRITEMLDLCGGYLVFSRGGGRPPADAEPPSDGVDPAQPPASVLAELEKLKREGRMPDRETFLRAAVPVLRELLADFGAPASPLMQWPVEAEKLLSKAAPDTA
jgi:hypothetical protein